MAKDEKKQEKPKKKKSTRSWSLLPLFFLIAAMVFYPFTILCVFGLLPAFVAWLVDRRPQKYVGQTVFIMNFCGILPFIIQLWRMGGHLKDSISLIVNPETYLWMYGAAAIGWGIVVVTPWIVNFTLNINYDDRLRRLQKQQKRLIEEWGPEVKERAPVEEDF